MKTFTNLLLCTIILFAFTGFKVEYSLQKKLSVSSTFTNSSSQTVPYVEISDNNGSDSDTNVPATTSTNLVLASISGTVEITVQLPDGHPHGRIEVKRGGTFFCCKSVSSGNSLVISIFDNNPTGDGYQITYSNAACSGASC